MKKPIRSLILLTIVAISGFASAICAQPLFRVDFNHQAVLIEPDTDKSATKRLEGTLENLTGDSITLTFHRYQDLWYGWSTSVCFGSNCFADFVDTSADFFGPHEKKELVLNMTAPPNAQDSAKVYLYLRAESKTKSDTIGLSVNAYSQGKDPLVGLPYRMIGDPRVLFDPGSNYVSTSVSNHSDQPLEIAVHGSAQMPAGWTGYYTLGDATLTGADTVVTLAPREGQNFSFNFDAPTLKSSDELVAQFSVTPSSNPSAAAVATVTAGSTATWSVSRALAVSRSASSASVSLSPNPAHPGSHLSLNGLGERTTLQIIDPLGRVVSTSASASGLYAPKTPGAFWVTFTDAHGANHIAPLVVIR